MIASCLSAAGPLPLGVGMFGVPTLFDAPDPPVFQRSHTAADDESRTRQRGQRQADLVVSVANAARHATNSIRATPTTMSPGMISLSFIDSPACGRVVLAWSTGSFGPFMVNPLAPSDARV